MSSLKQPKDSSKPDDLRHKCIDLLCNYIPKGQFSSLCSNTTLPEINIPKAREKFQRKNEKYVNALKDVMEVTKQAAKQRNLQALENFFKNLIAEPSTNEARNRGSQTAAKRKATSRPRSIKRCKREAETREVDNHPAQTYEPRPMKRCKREPETQEVDNHPAQTYEPLSTIQYSLPYLNPALPSISNQLESINTPIDLYQEPLSTALYYGLQQSSSLYFPYLSEEMAESGLFPQQSIFTYANSFQETQVVVEQTSQEEVQNYLPTYFHF